MASAVALGGATHAIAGPAEDNALLDAAFDVNVAAVKAALSKGANPNAYAGDNTPLNEAAFGGLGEKQKLINSGADRAEVIKSVNERATEVVKILLAAGARLGTHDKDILHFPISEGNVGLVRLLIENGARAKGRMPDGYTPTELARKSSQEEVYKLLIAYGGSAVDQKSSIQMAFVEAAFDADVEVMEAALQSGAGINDLDPAKNSPLAAALEIPVLGNKQAATIQWLLDHGANPNLPNNEGNPPLHVFVLHNTFNLNGKKGPVLAQLVEATLDGLLKAGAKISGVDKWNQTPLHVAARMDNVRAAEILIQGGAKIMPRDMWGKTPLDYAESAAMIKLLKANGATEQ
jgi:ankyrin repeat protein